MNILFRADGGYKVGMGHIMRCIALAKEFKLAGHNVCFCSYDSPGISRIEEGGFENHNTGFEGLSGLIELINRKKVDIAIVDSYEVDYKYLSSLNDKVSCLIYVDDLNRFVYPVDIIINGNINAKKLKYKKYKESQLLLLGARYFFLRREFGECIDKKTNGNIEHVLIATGGSDPHRMSIKFLELLKEKNVMTTVLVGDAYCNGLTDELQIRKKEDPNIELYDGKQSISKIVNDVDLVISSGGGMLYEICACQKPVLSFVYADNQVEIVKAFTELNCTMNLGNYEHVEDEFDNAWQMIQSIDKRKRMLVAQKMSVYSDGCKHVVKEIEAFFLGK